MGEEYVAQSWEVQTRTYVLEREDRCPPVIIEVVATDMSIAKDLQALPN